MIKDVNSRPSFTRVLKNPGFLNLWINQILVQLSYNSLNFTLIIWVFKLTDSNTAVSALLFAVYLPAVILGLFAGILVDLADKKKIIIGIDILLSILFFSLIFAKTSFPAILLITFLINALGQLYNPTEASAIPQIVKREELLTANSIFSATLYSCFLLGFGMAGPLISNLGIDVIFLMESLLLFIGFILAFAFPSIKTEPDSEGKKLRVALINKNFADIQRIGMEEIIQTINLIKGKLEVLVSIVILAAVQMVIGVLAVLMPAFLERSLQIKATDASYILVIPLGVGIVLGGIILGRVGNKFPRRILITRAILMFGLLFIVMGFAPMISPAMQFMRHPHPLPFFDRIPLSTFFTIGSFLLGIAMVSILVPSQTVLQENTPDSDRGKVYGSLGVAMAGLSLIPVLIAGGLADIFGVNAIFIGLGVLIILVASFGLNPSLFFGEHELSYKVKEFLGLGHWERK